MSGEKTPDPVSWQWLREGKPSGDAAEAVILILDGVMWSWALDGTRPDRFETIGMLICLVGMAVIMYLARDWG